ncbi:ferritin-like domain-containing protein [Dyadobacter aurulentus]|uniref:ferritin-like domain-containing protein n=1 Tax=Dyadobacter sp. UC 10 TaxID=2605428 RepID=UPI0011F3C6C7|nr:ferritin-like domain-containing protein [Dyadobacter sp. UC 10]KAA0991948.1 ferritin-like domain-containing protein [Dyadobacter sp. UC 10]
MNLFNILDQFEKFDGDAVDRIGYTSRRFFLNKISSKVAAAATPVILAGAINKAYAQSADAVEVLKFALTLEYLENEFYQLGNDASGLIPDMYKPVFEQIEKHELAHVKFLESALKIDPFAAKPTFDFTVGGTYAAFTNFDTFVFLSHAFEDTGVRAYKGQAGTLINDPQILEYALQVHSVEARHASISRKILAKIRNSKSIKSWITLDEGSPAPVYKGSNSEATIVQGGLNLLDLDLAGIPDGDSTRFKAATEAFDEILTKQETLDIATPFIKM